MVMAFSQEDEFAQPCTQEGEKTGEAQTGTEPREEERQEQGQEDTPLVASISTRTWGVGHDEDQDEEGGRQSPSQVPPALNLPAHSPCTQLRTDNEPLAPLPEYVARPSDPSALTSISSSSSSSSSESQGDAESRVDQSLESVETMVARIQTQAEMEAREEMDLLKAECERSATAAGQAQADAENLLARLEREEQDSGQATREVPTVRIPAADEGNLEDRPKECKGGQVDAEDNGDVSLPSPSSSEIFAGIQPSGVLYGRSV